MYVAAALLMTRHDDDAAAPPAAPPPLFLFAAAATSKIEMSEAREDDEETSHTLAGEAGGMALPRRAAFCRFSVIQANVCVLPFFIEIGKCKPHVGFFVAFFIAAVHR